MSPTQSQDRHYLRSPLLFVTGHWEVVGDANDWARGLYHRHYSRYKYHDGRNPKKFTGPGQTISLLSWDGSALFVWRKFISMDKVHGHGINCAVFRNEGKARSSELILEAEGYARLKWPGERFYTYVNPKKIRSTNPGYCFKAAGWRFVKITPGGLHLLEKSS